MQIQKPNLTNADTIKWRYKTSKDNVTFSTNYQETTVMTISCTSQNEVDGSIGNTCASNGSKTATVTSVNNSSSNVYYLIEYALEQNPSNWLSVTDSFGLPTQGSKDDLVNLPEGSYFTLRYKTSR